MKNIFTLSACVVALLVSGLQANAQSFNFKKFVKTVSNNNTPTLKTVPTPGGPQVMPAQPLVPGQNVTPYVMPVKPVPVYPTPVVPGPGCQTPQPVVQVVPVLPVHPVAPASPVLGTYLLPVSMHTGSGLVQGLKVTSVYRHRPIYGEDAFGTQREYRFRTGADIILAINGIPVTQVHDVQHALQYGWNTLSIWDSATHAYGDYQVFVD